MKIAYIGQKGIPAKIGGVEKHVEELAVKMAEKSHNVFVYARNNYNDKKLKEFKGVKIIYLPSISTKNLDAISHTFLATIHALFQNYDIIHFHSIGPSSLSFLIRLFKRKTKLVATYHCQDYFHQKWGFFAKSFLQFGEWMICKAPQKTIVVSNTLKSFLKNRYEKETTYIPNGFSISENFETDEIEKLDLQKNGYILSVNRLVKHKGIHYLIEAFKKLEDKNLSAGKKLVIVGEGFYTNEYVKKIKKMSEGRKIIIFTGVQTGKILNQLFSNAFLYVHSSQSEGLSISLLEAMGHGKTILSSDIPENVEAISNDGFYFENGNAEDLESKLEEILKKDADVLKEMGEKARVRANEKYDWNKIVDKTENLYTSLLLQKKYIDLTKTYERSM